MALDLFGLAGLLGTLPDRSGNTNPQLAKNALLLGQYAREEAKNKRRGELMQGLLGQKEKIETGPVGSQAEFDAFNQVPFELAGQTAQGQAVTGYQPGEGLLGGQIGLDEFIGGLLSAPDAQLQELGGKLLTSRIDPDVSDLPAAVREYQWFLKNVAPKSEEAIKQYMSLKRAGFTLGGQRYAPITDMGRPYVTVPAQETARGENIVGLAQQAAKEGKRIGRGGMEVVPGSASAEEAETKKRTAAKMAGFISRDIRLAKELLDKSADNPYFRKAQSWMPGTDEYEFEQQIKSLQATIGIDSLLDIKREGAGLGQVPQSQLDLLSRLLGQLGIARDKKIQKKLLKDIQNTYANVLKRMSEEDIKKYDVANRELNLYNQEQEEQGAPPPPPGFNRKVNQ